MLRPSRRKSSVTPKPSEFQNNGTWKKCYQSVIKTGGRNRKTVGMTGLFGFRFLFPLAPCKSILNAFVYEIYQRVFILFELSVKHTLSDFLLPFRCHKYTINLLINQDLIWATKVSFIFLFKSLIFLNWETFISLTITSCNLSGMSAETNSRYLVII